MYLLPGKPQQTKGQIINLKPAFVVIALVLAFAAIIALAFVTSDGEPMTKDEFDVLCISQGGVPSDSFCLKGTTITMVR